MRTSSLAVALLLAGCNSAKTDPAALANAEAWQRAEVADAGQIECAKGGQGFSLSCTLDREMTKDGQVLTVRHPDGAFHRLLVTTDGRGVAAADGAQPAVVTVIGGDRIEVAIGGDRYRLPATVKAAKPRG